MIVPTLGHRPALLEGCLASIANQGVPCDIVIVAPPDNIELQGLARSYDAEIVPDPGSLAAAINVGASRLNTAHEFVNWLGDDDALEPDSLKSTIAALDAHPSAVAAFGWCRYVDENERELWMSKAGPWAPRILAWGPDLIPQPGMLVRSHAWQQVGGLDESYRFAFDLDLLLKLKKLGPLVSIPHVVSRFRWHADSLTVSDRTTNLRESERARRAALNPMLRPIAWIWEKPMQALTKVAAQKVNKRAQLVANA